MLTWDEVETPAAPFLNSPLPLRERADAERPVRGAARFAGC